MKEKLVITDEEIRGFMDFDGLVEQAGTVTYWTKIQGNFKIIMGSMAAVAVAVIALVIITDQQETVTTADHAAPTNAQTAPQVPAGNGAVIDSVVSLKAVPQQRLPSLSVRPKKKAIAVQEQRSDGQKAPAPTPVVYHEAEPIEGFHHLYEYFIAQLKYPAEAEGDSIQGLVTVTFVITSQGQIDKIGVLNSLGPLFDAEAIRLIKNMPAWKPATINGKPVPSRFSLPLTFQFKRENQ